MLFVTRVCVYQAKTLFRISIAPKANSVRQHVLNRVFVLIQTKDFIVLPKMSDKGRSRFQDGFSVPGLAVRRISKGCQTVTMPEPSDVGWRNQVTIGMLMNQRQPQIAVSAERLLRRPRQGNCMFVKCLKELEMVLG
jgi:hypothetical protein